MGFLDNIGKTFSEGKGTPWGGGGMPKWWENVKSGDPATHNVASLAFTGTPFDSNLGAQAVGNTLGFNDPVEAPKYEKYKQFNPNDYSQSGFDNSQISKNMQRDIASGAAQRKQQQLAQLGKMGVRGADSTAAMSRVGSEQERAIQNIQAQLARQNYEDAWRQYMAGAEGWEKQQDRDLEVWQAKEQMKAEDKAANSLNLGTVASLYGMSGGFGKKGK